MISMHRILVTQALLIYVLKITTQKFQGLSFHFLNPLTNSRDWSIPFPQSLPQPLLDSRRAREKAVSNESAPSETFDRAVPCGEPSGRKCTKIHMFFQACLCPFLKTWLEARGAPHWRRAEVSEDCKCWELSSRIRIKMCKDRWL